ncbi:MAG: Y-family DNA polymerase [Synechococcaceae cyanobacterium]|nr:Y-family DNA polymerase [Synechococcaceae cyanobacterium]
MAPVTVLIDGNNFYASCEALLDPTVVGRPLVVLSNNDGCIVSRSREARALGIPMGVPYFQIAQQLQRQGVVVRSSNYALYADMSQRLMTVLEQWVEELEIYSIDEAFGRLQAPRPRPGDPADLSDWGQRLRADVRRRLGLPVAVGIAPSKVLSKIANRIAKGDPVHRGVFDLHAVAVHDPWLAAIPVEDIWGIGRRLSRWCRLRGISTALDLRDRPMGELRQRCGVVGVRLQQELRGQACLPLIRVPPAKRETCVSRSFGTPIHSLEELRQAVATYLSRAAEKLRRQGQLAGSITVFVRSNPFDGTVLVAEAASVQLPLPSNDTGTLLQAALPLTQRLYRHRRPLHKAGVVLRDLQGDDRLQQHLLVPLPVEQRRRRERLMAAIDALNQRYGRGTVQWAACGLQPRWRMRRSRLSGSATTRLGDIPVAHCS